MTTFVFPQSSSLQLNKTFGVYFDVHDNHNNINDDDNNSNNNNDGDDDGDNNNNNINLIFSCAARISDLHPHCCRSFTLSDSEQKVNITLDI